MADPLHAQLLLSLVFLGLAGLVAYSAWLGLRRRQQAWSDFAQRYGLMLTSVGLSNPRITGIYEGQHLELKVEQRGSGKSRYSVTVLHLRMSDVLSPDFFLEREGLGDKFLKLLGRKDEEIGHEDFDRYFDLKNLDPESATLLRHPDVQQHLFTVARTYHGFSIRHGFLSVEERTVPSSSEALESFVQPALALAQALKSPNQGASRRRATS